MSRAQEIADAIEYVKRNRKPEAEQICKNCGKPKGEHYCFKWCNIMMNDSPVFEPQKTKQEK